MRNGEWEGRKWKWEEAGGENAERPISNQEEVGGQRSACQAVALAKAGAQRSVLFEQQNHVAMGVNFIAVAEVSAGPSSLDSADAQLWSPG
jgi:hypothetical protein